MRILLDTHIFLWATTGDIRLSPAQRDLFLDDASDLCLSVASVWEMLIKTSLGRLPMPTPSTDYIVRQMEKNRIAHPGGAPKRVSDSATAPPRPLRPDVGGTSAHGKDAPAIRRCSYGKVLQDPLPDGRGSSDLTNDRVRVGDLASSRKVLRRQLAANRGK